MKKTNTQDVANFLWANIMASGLEKNPVQFVGPVPEELKHKFHHLVSAYLGDTCDIGMNHVVISDGGKTWRRQTWYKANARKFTSPEECWQDLFEDMESSSLCRAWREQNGREIPVFTES